MKTIAEVADTLKVNESTLRFWEDEFELKIKRVNNHRKYSEEDIVYLQNIYFLLKIRKLTIEGAKAELQKDQNIEIKRVTYEKLKENLQDIKKELLEIRKDLNLHPTFAESVIID